MNFKEFKEKFEKNPVKEISNRVNSAPMVSVCVQTYQHENYIKECLDGILMQKTTFPFEILLGEDDSSDGTREICRDYAAKYPNKIRLFLHHRDNNININGKPTGRFNLLYNIYSARGKYIALCEGDDYWTDPLKLERQVEFLENKEDCSFCFHKAYKFIENQEQLKAEFPTGITANVLTASEYLEISSTATCSLLFKNIPLKALTALIHSHGDFLIYCSLLEDGEAGFIDEIMSVYRIHERGISYNYTSPIYLLNRIKELKIEQTFFSKKLINQEIGRIYKEHIKRYLSLNKNSIPKSLIFYLKKELLLNRSFQKDIIDFF